MTITTIDSTPVISTQYYTSMYNNNNSTTMEVTCADGHNTSNKLSRKHNPKEDNKLTKPRKRRPSKSLASSNKSTTTATTTTSTTSIASTKQISCSNCAAEKTPLWRKGADGNTLCNKCGLYWSRHGKHRPVKLDRSTPRRQSTSRKSANSSTDSDYSSPSSPMTPPVAASKKRKQSTSSILTKRAHSPVTPTKSSKRVKRENIVKDEFEDDDFSSSSSETIMSSDLSQDGFTTNSFFFQGTLSSSDEEEQACLEQFLQEPDNHGNVVENSFFNSFMFPPAQPQQPVAPTTCEPFTPRTTAYFYIQQQQQQQIMEQQQQLLIDQNTFACPSVGLSSSTQQFGIIDSNEHYNNEFLSLFDNEMSCDQEETMFPIESGSVDDVVDMIEGRSPTVVPIASSNLPNTGACNIEQGTFLSF